MAKYQTVCLGDVTDLITKGTTPTTLGFSFQDEGINFVKIESITEIGTFLQEKFEHISNDCNEKLKRSQLKENDILFSIAGAIGRTAFVTKDILPANTNQALAIIRLDDDRLLHEYVIYALKSDLIYKQFEKQKQGVAQLNISLKDVSDFIIPLPPLETQRQIAANLDKVTHTIDLCNAILEKLDMLVKSRFVEMFGEPIDNPMGWEVKPLKELSTLITNGNTPKGGSENYVESGITFLRSQNVWRNRIDLSDVAYIDEETHQKMKKASLTIMIFLSPKQEESIQKIVAWEERLYT
jgi:type I restriction enzyme S subunit